MMRNQLFGWIVCAAAVAISACDDGEGEAASDELTAASAASMWTKAEGVANLAIVAAADAGTTMVDGVERVAATVGCDSGTASVLVDLADDGTLEYELSYDECELDGLTISGSISGEGENDENDSTRATVTMQGSLALSGATVGTCDLDGEARLVATGTAGGTSEPSSGTVCGFSAADVADAL